MKNIFFFISFLSPFILTAQSLWNDTIPLGYPSARITDMIVDNDTIVVYGTGFNNAIQYKQGLIIAQLDSNGSILKNKILLDSLGDKLAVDDNWGKIIKTKDGGYAATAAPFARNSFVLIKLNHHLDVQFIKEYSDTVNASNYFYLPKEVPGGYFLYGAIQLQNLKSVGIIKYVNDSGTLIWERQFDYASHGTWIVDLAQLTDSSFVFVTAEALSAYSISTPQSFRAGLYYLNMAGEITGSWKSGAEPEIGYLRKVIPVGENGFITYGMQLQQIINETVLIGQPTLTKFNTSFQKEWIHHFGLAKPLDWYLTLYDFAPTSDGNYVGAGKTRIENIGEDAKIHGWIYKFSPEGDSIWSRDFPTPLPDYFPFSGELYGIGTLSSGHIVAGGYARTGQSLHCWIVKLTNDGCMDTLFCQTSAIKDIPESVKINALKVFPNPATETLNISYDHLSSSGGYLRILDIYGHVIEETNFSGNITTVNVSQIPTGIYYLEIYNGNSFEERIKIMVSH